jgi:group I intron endonuclease
MEIYKIKNLINGKCYVGKSVKNNENYFGSGTIIRRAIKKYGKNNFEKTVLWQGLITEKELNEKEIFWIKELVTQIPYGYNISSGGIGFSLMQVPWNKGKKGIFSQEVIEKLRIAGRSEKNKIAHRGDKNGKYKKISDTTMNVIFNLYNQNFSSSQISSYFKDDIDENISRKKIISVISEGAKKGLILTDDERKINCYNIEHSNLLNYINEYKIYKNQNHGLISYIAYRTGYCRKTIRDLLKNHNLYYTKTEIIVKKPRKFLKAFRG